MLVCQEMLCSVAHARDMAQAEILELVDLDENADQPVMVPIVQDCGQRSSTMVNFKRILFPVDFTPNAR